MSYKSLHELCIYGYNFFVVKRNLVFSNVFFF